MRNAFNPLGLEGKKILVVGASGGIGGATAVYLSRLGARIVAVGRDERRLGQTVDKLVSGNHLSYCIDLADTDGLEAAMACAVSDGSKFDGMVYAAGIARIMPLNALKRDGMQAELEINYLAFIQTVRLYAKRKCSNSGGIVGISSIAATQAEKGQTNYSASKAAMDAASQALAIELAPRGIRINTVLPGVVKTKMLENSIESGIDTDAILGRQLLGLVEPDDVAAACAFLLSDMSRRTTGRQFYVDGGRLG